MATRRWAVLTVAAAAAWGAFLAAPSAGAANVNCVNTVAAVASAGQTVCFSSDPTAGVTRVPANETPSDGTTLIFSADPEHVSQPGILYQDTVDGPGEGPAFRVYAYHVNGQSTGDLYVGILLTNGGSSDATVTITRLGSAGPSTDPLQTGKLAVERWLSSTGGGTIDVPAGGSVWLDPAQAATAVPPGALVNTIVDATASAPVTVTVVAEASPSTTSVPTSVLPSDHLPLPMRGTFQRADVTGNYSLSSLANPAMVFHVADTSSYLVGSSAVDGGERVVDYGNYGVLYTENMNVSLAAGASLDRFTLLFDPRGGNFDTAVHASPGALGGGSPGSPLPADNIFLPASTTGAYAAAVDSYCTPPGATSDVQVQWMPAGATFMPVDLLVNPLSAGSTAGAAPDPCGPSLFAVAPATVGAGSGQSVTLTGSGFGGSPGTVTFQPSGGSPVSVSNASSWNDGSVTVVVPASLPAGNVAVSVTPSTGGPPSNTQTLDIAQPPQIAAVTPSTAEPGLPLVLSGTGFGDATTASVYLTPSGAPQQTLHPAVGGSDTSLQVTLPAGTPVGPATLQVGNGVTGLLSNVASIAVATPVAAATTSLPAGEVGSPYLANAGVSGGVSPYTWSVASGSLPPGVSLSPSGILQGTPTSAGTYAVTLEVRDADGGTSSTAVSIAVSAAPEPAPVSSSPPPSSQPQPSPQPSPQPGSSGGTTSSSSGGSTTAYVPPPVSIPPVPVPVILQPPPPTITAGVPTAVHGRLTVSTSGAEAAIAASPSSPYAALDLGSAEVGPGSALLALDPGALQALVGASKGVEIRFHGALLDVPAADLDVAALRASNPRAAHAAPAVLWVGVSGSPGAGGPVPEGSLARRLRVPFTVSAAGPEFTVTFALGGAHRVDLSALPTPASWLVPASAPGSDAQVAGFQLRPGAVHYVPSTLLATQAASIRLRVDGPGTFAPLSVAVHYRDAAGEWFTTAVDAVQARGLLTGAGQADFSPAVPVSRAVIAVAVQRLLGLSPDAAAARRFRDVPRSAWYAAALGAAVRAGVLEGVGPSAFDPNGDVTRAQAAAIWMRVVSIAGLHPGLGAAPPFRDESAIPNWAAAGATFAARSGLIAGFPDGTFRPDARMTRAQVAEVMWRFLAFGLPQPQGRS